MLVLIFLDQQEDKTHPLTIWGHLVAHSSSAVDLLPCLPGCESHVPALPLTLDDLINLKVMVSLFVSHI